MREIYEYTKSDKNLLIVGFDEYKNELVKSIIKRDLNEKKIVNIVLDTTGKYKSLEFISKKVCLFKVEDYSSTKFFKKLKSKKLLICDLSNIKNKIEVIKDIIKNTSSISHKKIRIILDDLYFLPINIELDNILNDYINLKDNIKIWVVTRDAYGLYDSIDKFDSYIFFRITPCIRDKFKHFVESDILNKSIKLFPSEYILYEKYNILEKTQAII